MALIPESARGGENELAYAQPANELLTKLGADRQRGPSEPEAARRFQQHGVNELAQTPDVAWWKKFLGQFNSLVVWILMVAAVIAGGMGEWIDTVAILAIVFLNGILGYLQEAKAEQAIEALKKMSAPLAKVLRSIESEIRSIQQMRRSLGNIVERCRAENSTEDCPLVYKAKKRSAK